MVVFPLEYTLCQLQSGQISLAIKTHRRENGNPEVEITVRANDVLFRLLNLFDGIPETVLGDRRQDHVDFYFLLDDFRNVRNQFPTVAAPPNRGLLLQTFDPSGTERRGGKNVRMGGPLFRLPVTGAQLENRRPPAPVFRAVASDPHLFLDFELTPVRGYGAELGEIHFGVNGDFEIVDAAGVSADHCDIVMTHETYATVRDEAMRL
jgi:hypothetical protein